MARVRGPPEAPEGRGPSYRTRHHHEKEKNLPEPNEAPGAKLPGKLVPEFPEPTWHGHEAERVVEVAERVV